ncbi:hypothetical protein [Winogradskyella alexanderae]|uniref:YD repeat-containing protein n=1 Tax=Winogradskyella alexanderae TaxID=2877123 RepID=A0ABS7XUL1_9FLAO|nr:hypothetical protein [Winogradskyella alexanderae]MCA0133708.1 hypothetical protein [Winogradskyella alexanderae]
MSRRILILISFAIIYCGCSKDDTSGDNETISDTCKIKKISGDVYELEFVYNQNKILQIKRTVGTTQTFDIIGISVDSTIINESGTSQLNPLVSMKYNDQRLVQLNYYYNSGTYNIYTFEYNSNRIRVKQDFYDGLLYNIRFADYYYNSSGNIINVKYYTINDDNSSELTNDVTYSYDDHNNPWKNITFHTFFFYDLPEPRFFSNNNVLNVNSSLYTDQNEYSYNEDGYTAECINREESYEYLCD